MRESLRSPESSGETGSTSRPRGEETLRHAGSAGEASRGGARQISHQAESMIDPDDSVEGSGEYEIVRATSRFQLDFKHGHPKGAGGKDICSVCALMYALRVTQNRCAGGINMAIREYWRTDSEVLDAYMAEQGVVPRGKAWPFPVLSIYQSIRASYPELASGIAASLAQKAMKKWKQYRYDALIRKTCSPPHFRETMPIPIRRQDIRVVSVGQDAWNLRFSLTSGRHLNGTEYAVPIKARDAFQRDSLNAIAAGDWRMGEVTIEPDKRKPGRWYAKISYKRKIQAVPRDERYGAVNRGIICSLAAVTYDGDDFVDDGYDIEEYLKRCKAWRRQYQRSYRLSQRRGRGRKRALKPIDRLSGKADRWRKTRLQETARRFAMWFAAKDVSVVFLEDFSGIRDGAPEKLSGGKMVWDRIQEWPYYELGTRLRSCLEEEGIVVIDVPLQDFSRTCPWCSHEHEEKKVLPDRIFKCDRCGKKRHYDVMQATNVMHRGREWLSGDKGPEAKLLEKTAGQKVRNRTARKSGRK